MFLFSFSILLAYSIIILFGQNFKIYDGKAFIKYNS